MIFCALVRSQIVIIVTVGDLVGVYVGNSVDGEFDGVYVVGTLVGIDVVGLDVVG